MTNVVAATAVSLAAACTNLCASLPSSATTLSSDPRQYRNCVEVPIVLRDANHRTITTNYLDVTEFYNFMQTVRQALVTR